MEHATQLFAAIAFLVIGLSHFIQPKAWVAFYQALAARGTSGAFLEGFLLLNFGAFNVAFHNVWHGPAVVLTLIGWSQVQTSVVNADLARHCALEKHDRAGLLYGAKYPAVSIRMTLGEFDAQ